MTAAATISIVCAAVTAAAGIAEAVAAVARKEHICFFGQIAPRSRPGVDRHLIDGIVIGNFFVDAF